MDKCNDNSLSALMNNIDLAPQPDTDYDFATESDIKEYSIHSLAAAGALNIIQYLIDDYDPRDQNLQSTALYNYLRQFDFSEDSPTLITDLLTIRENFMNFAYINDTWDQAKCFLHLLTYKGTPMYVTDFAGDDPIVTEIGFKNFKIKKTYYCDFDEFSYTINVNFAQLLLLLSGDVEENPGPNNTTQSCEETQRKKINQMQREIEKLKKLQRQHQNFMQRQVELEKRNRKKKRENGADRKRYAQSAVEMAKEAVQSCARTVKNIETAKAAGYLATNWVVPGLGTALATVVNGPKITAAIDKINPTIDMLQGVLKSLTEAADQLKAVFGIPKDYDVLEILIACVSICQHLKDKNMLLLTVYCTNLARHLGITLGSLMSLIPNICPTNITYAAGSDTRQVAQSLVSDMFSTAVKSPELLPFSGFLAFFCGIFSLLCSGSVPTPAEMAKHFSTVGRAAQGFKAVRDLFVWIFDYLAEIYYTTVYGVSAEEYKFIQNFPQIENLYAAVTIIEQFDKSLIDASAAISEQIMTVGFQLGEYHSQATRVNSRSNTQMIQSLQKRIHSQIEWASHSPARCHTIRTQPVAVYLYGHPGVGKSVATEVLKARIYAKYLKETHTDFNTISFPRRAKNEYWEGYTGQPIVILDDFGNVIDSQQKPVEEYEELEYMVNTAQYPLKMAELKSKGVSNFTSEFIIASSNQKYPAIVSLVDPGAVFRRFHVWAEVTIDPAYGVPLGRDDRGGHYYTFDKKTAAEKLNCTEDKIPPLVVDHYRFTCYKVSHNKQSGNAEVYYIPGKNNLTFDKFWEYFCEENDRRKQDSQGLAEAIMKMAGIEKPAPSLHERQILEKFDRIFNPEKFIEAVAEAEDFQVELGENFFDAEDDETFGSIAHMYNIRARLNKIKEMFYVSKARCNNSLQKMWKSAKACITAAENKLITIAQFFLSFFSNTAQKFINYLPSVPTSDILVGICSTAAALFGVWYTGIFRSKSADSSSAWCQFNRSPSDATAPCDRCASCKILQYPKHGNMLVHFLERTGIKSVRNDLLKQGISRDDLENVREEVRISLQRPVANTVVRQCRLQQLVDSGFRATNVAEAHTIVSAPCWYDCTFCESYEEESGRFDLNNGRNLIDQTNNFLDLVAEQQAAAQGVYDTQPRVSRPVNYAQRIYETQPAVPKQRQFAQRVYESNPRVPRARRLAQGLVDCLPNTEMHLGARRYTYAQRDRVQIEQTTQVLLNNSVWIQAVDKNGMCCRSNGVFLVGRTMITTAHTIMNPPHIDPIEYLVIQNPYSTERAIEIPIDQCKISQAFQIDGSPVDLALVSFPPVVPNRQRILSKFLNAGDIDLLKEGDLTFSGFYQHGNKTIVQEKYPQSFTVSTKTTEYFLHAPGTCPKDPTRCVCPIKIGNHIDYDLETSNGMCGALLSISNKLIHTKLIGFHVAGGAGVLALGVLTTRQFLEKALSEHIERFKIPKSYLIDGRLPYSQSWVDTTKQVSLIELGDCLNVGTAPAPAAPSTTQLAPSMVFDKIQQHIAKPAYLRPVEVEGEGLVDPMLKGIKKIMGRQTFVDPDLLEAAANDVFQGLGTPIGGKGVVHSYEQAITGVDGDPYKRPINRTTSPGYPYNLTNKTKGKTAWLGDGEEYIVDNPELRKDVESLISDSRKGIRGNAISIATLKDEKRPIAKVDAGKTRVFEACPQHLVIAIRQYFLDFAAHVMRNRIDNGIAVGINPYSLEWTKLAHHLQSKGNYMIAGDFSNFDGSLLMQVLVKIVEKINDWYGDSEENQLIRAALWEHICNADILVRGEVIRKTHSQPSGNPLTVIINSLFNGIVMRIAYMLLKKEQGLPATCDYRKYVSEIIYGDDDIKSVSTEITHWFNQLTLTDALASFGLTYTDETKTGKILPFKPLEDVAFLKRKFVIQKDGTFLAPMDLTNTLEITNWIRGKAKRTATIENCEQTIMELSLHPQEVYEYWSTRIREELAAVGLSIQVPTYYEQMETYRYNRDMYARTEYVPLW